MVPCQCRTCPVRRAADAFFESFGGNVPDWLLPEADALASAIKEDEPPPIPPDPG